MKKMTPTSRIGDLSSDPKVAVQQIVAAFNASIDEAQALSRSESASWAVCFATDFCAFRTDGREIRLYGDCIYTNTSQTEAMEVAKILSAKSVAGGSPQVIALPVGEWATHRIAKLERMIKEVTENAAKQA